MKIRRGFVTNSSSSSFVIAFNDADCVEDTIHDAVFRCLPAADEWMDLSDEDFGENIVAYAVRGIKKSQIGLEELTETLDERLRMCARWKFYYNLREFWNKNNYLQSQEYLQKEQEYVETRMREIMEKIKDKKYIAYVEFSDNDGSVGSYVEHELAPYLEETICSFSNH